MNPIHATSTRALSTSPRVLPGEMQPIPKSMNFVHSHSLGPGITATSEISPNHHVNASTLLFKIHNGRCISSENVSTFSKHDRTQQQEYCQCGGGTRSMNSTNSSLLTSMSCSCKKSNDAGQEKIIQWNVDKVHEIPPYFHIERAHEYIDDVPPSEISRRISDCFKEDGQSISVVYDDDEAVACAETNDKTRPEYCKFQVRLYKANDSPSILVECQRRSGCCIKFHSMAMRILCAARGCEYKDECPHASISKNFLDEFVLGAVNVSSEHETSSGRKNCEYNFCE